MLLAYLKSVPPGHTHHLAKACYALENFVENLGNDGSGACRGVQLWLKRAEYFLPELLPVMGRRVWKGHTQGQSGGWWACRRLKTWVDGRGTPFPTGPKVQPYLPELMDCVLQPLRNPSSPRAKELAVSALGAIGEEKEAGDKGTEFTQSLWLPPFQL